ncbi:MAG: winged helix-turn-helix domain-containing protein [Nitrososphaerales archaeon]
MVTAATATSLEFVSQSEVRARVLTVLSKASRTPTEIARLEDKHVSHVCRSIKELEAQGLVEVAWSESGERYYRTTRSGCALVLNLSQRTK